MEKSKYSKSTDDLLESEEFWPYTGLASTSVLEGEPKNLKRLRLPFLVKVNQQFA